MNKKQCPKCGEENPIEAVMCWACYTPLSGAATVSAGASAAGAGTAVSSATGDEGEKKKIPPWQLGIIGVGLLMAVGLGVRSMMPASSSVEDPSSIDIPAPEGGDPGMVAPPSPPQQQTTPQQGGGGGGQVAPPEAPFKIAVPPDPRQSIATMAIVPTQPGVSGATAASYASYVRRQYAGQAKKWSTIYIYVFSDAQSAQTFANVMKRRRGVSLSSSDYSALANLWSSVLVRYEYSSRGGKGVERILYPSKNPSGWWYGRT